MTEYTLTFNDTELEVYGNLSLGSKKVKQDDWFIIEPQSLKFDLLWFDNPQTRGQETSNWVYDRIFRTGIIRDGMVYNFIVRLYRNETLIFTGYVSATESKRMVILKAASIFCYDMTGLLSLLKDAEISIIDNYRLLSAFLETDLQGAIDGKNYIPDIEIINNSANLIKTVEDLRIPINRAYRYDPVNSNSFIKYGFVNNMVGAGSQDEGDSRGTIFFAYEMAQEIYPFGVGGDNVILYEYILIRFDGLYYSEIFNKNSSKTATDSPSIVISELEMEMESEFSEYFDLPMDELWSEMYTYPGGAGRTRLYEFVLQSIYGTYINFTGSIASMNMTSGKYLNDGYNANNTSNIIDVLKMYLTSNDLLCYSVGKQVIIDSYNGFTPISVITDDDIYSIEETIILPNNSLEKIDSLSGGEDAIMLSQLNEYYSALFNSTKSYNIKLSKEANTSLAVGKKLRNLTYFTAGDIYIIELSEKIENNYITVKGILI